MQLKIIQCYLNVQCGLESVPVYMNSTWFIQVKSDGTTVCADGRGDVKCALFESGFVITYYAQSGL